MYEAEHSLSAQEIGRYSRQMILPEIGARGQMRLKNCRVLIVGAGGLGCPCAIYLAASGVGTIGIVDGDIVEESNLHRQVLHTEERIGTSKADSIKTAIEMLNSNVSCVVYKEKLVNENALRLVQAYDVICDCSDNAPTRYLTNDACALARKPLVSGSALRWDGQLTVYSAGQGPCYRCLYPKPPPAETVTSCAQGGVLGTIPGTIGTLQANEVVKIASGIESSFIGHMLIYNGKNGEFKRIKLRPRNRKCEACGDSPTIQFPINYESFCGTPSCDSVRPVSVLIPTDRVTVNELKQLLSLGEISLIDCRPKHQWDIGHFAVSINLPMDFIEKEDCAILQPLLEGRPENVYVICHRGNQSQLAVVALRKKLGHLNRWNFRDVIGGYEAWSREIDNSFPIY